MRLLIGEPSELLGELLRRRLEQYMEVVCCRDGEDALALLHSFRPDATILNLSLPRKDGLTILRQTSFLPRVILGTAGFIAGPIQQTAYALGVSQMLLMPSVNGMVTALMGLLEQTQDPMRPPDIREQARFYLQELNIQPNLEGYKCLAVALPLFAGDMNQTLSKELYPAVAEVMNLTDGRAVEHAIRNAITRAWKTRQAQVWEKYFPQETKCPNNKLFLCRLCQLMTIE